MEKIKYKKQNKKYWKIRIVKIGHNLERSNFNFLNSVMVDRINHETIIRTGITCKKIPCYMGDSACRWFIVKKAKIF